MEQSKFSFELTPNNPTAKLGFEVWINDQCSFATDHVQESMTVEGLLPEDSVEAGHVLKLVLKNKQPEHTQLSELGEILQDSCLTVSNLSFDDIKLGQIVNHLSVYQHDFNGTADSGQHRFYGTMGCNGTVTLEFSTPMYIWLLENM
jgi:hypothetical protein